MAHWALAPWALALWVLAPRAQIRWAWEQQARGPSDLAPESAPPASLGVMPVLSERLPDRPPHRAQQRLWTGDQPHSAVRKRDRAPPARRLVRTQAAPIKSAVDSRLRRAESMIPSGRSLRRPPSCWRRAHPGRGRKEIG